MKPADRALLQERVKTLVLRHALEVALARLAAVAGPSAADDLTRVEHVIVQAARSVDTAADATRLATLVAVEDAVGTVRATFDAVQGRLGQAVPARRSAPLAA